MNETATKTRSLLDRLPELQGGKMPPIDANLTHELVQTFLQGGKDAIVGLIDTLREVDNGSDWKTRFLLHSLVSSVGSPAQAAPQELLGATLLDAAAGSRHVYVRTFLLIQLRRIASPDMVPKIIALLAAEAPQLADAAAAALVSIGAPAKAPLAAALKGAQGRQQEVIENALRQIA